MLDTFLIGIAVGYYYSPIGSGVRTFDWYRKW